jgi:hypothetical protein
MAGSSHLPAQEYVKGGSGLNKPIGEEPEPSPAAAHRSVWIWLRLLTFTLHRARNRLALVSVPIWQIAQVYNSETL